MSQEIEEEKFIVIKNKHTGFTAFSEDLQMNVPVDNIIELEKNKHCDVIFTIRPGSHKELYQIWVPPIIGMLSYVKLIRKSKEVTGNIILDVIIIKYNKSMEEMKEFKEEMKLQYNIAKSIFGDENEKEKKSIPELVNDIEKLWGMKGFNNGRV